MFNTPRITDLTNALQGCVPRLAKHEDFGRIFEGGGSQFGRKRACTRLEQKHAFLCKVGLLRVQLVGALRVLVVRMDWHVIMQVSNAITRSECRICLGTRRALAGNEQVGMRAPASEQGR